MEDFVSLPPAGKEANQSEPLVVVGNTDQIFSGFDVSARDAPGKVDQIWKVGLISSSGFFQFGKAIDRLAHTQQQVTALPMRVGVVRRPTDCLVHRGERAGGVAEFFFGVAEFDPEIVVAIAQGRSSLERLIRSSGSCQGQWFWKLVVDG